MSPILQSIGYSAGGVLAGLALAGSLLLRQQRALTEARHQATHDDTTGLPNRRAAISLIRRSLQRGEPFGLVLLDLDQFKSINDLYGHVAGNDILVAVGHRLTVLPPPVVLAARLSGDEFALVVDGDARHVRDAAELAWQIIGADPIALGAEPVEVHASVGHACARAGVTVRQLLRDADEAMYLAKARGTGVHGPATTTTDTASSTTSGIDTAGKATARIDTAAPGPATPPARRCRDLPRR